MITQDLGIATAYGYAKSKGYTGTEAEFAELMASYATVGQTAVDAKDAAVAAKTAAQTAATTATNKATEATTAATTATTKAGEASTSASTATSAKNTAVSASQTATSKATEATTAAATATSAATTATTAKDDAVNAKTAAQTAQTGAETAAASVQASAAQIQTNADDISELKEDLTHAFPHDTVSGAVASFADGADDVPMDSVIVSIEPVQAGSGDPSPDNVRPITGWTGAKVTRTGKNLLYANAENKTIGGLTFTVVDNGSSFYVNGTTTANVALTLNSGAIAPQKLKKGLTYTLSGGHWSSVDVAYIQLMYQGDATGNTISIVSTVGQQTVTLDEDATLTRIYINFRSGNTFNNDLVKPQLELGSTATDYEPYQGDTYDIAFPSEAGTVYGGTLDVTNGVLTVDRAIADLGKWNWTMSSVPQGNLFRTPNVVNSVLQYNGLNIICSNYPTVKASQRQDKTMSIGSDNRVDIIDSNYSDTSAFKTAMSGVQLCYELDTPITVQLTPHEVTALLGSNNVWADTGDSAVEYRADPTLYIQRLTEPDADMVADANITSGQYFMVGNTLYKATANIASGGAITPNVNCTRKSLSEALNELNV